MSGSSTNAIATSIQRNATRGFAPAGCGRRLLRVGLQAEVSISWMCISVPWVPGKRNMAEPDQAAFWNARYAANEYLFGTQPNAFLARESHQVGSATCRERVCQ